MYNLPYHKAENEREISDFIKGHPFAFISGCDSNNRPIATQIPVFIEEKGIRKTLIGHMMKNTDHHKAFLNNENILVVFSGKHTYISGTWYSNPHTPSTWNYMSVHAKGTIRFLEDDALKDVLRKTSLYFEENNTDSTTVYDNLPFAFKEKILPAIVAFEIEIHEIDSVFKLSQDRDESSYQNIIKKLRQQGQDAQEIATEMEKRAKKLFPGSKEL